MSTQKNLITLCFATVFALGLAACGGGGGGDAPVTGMMDGDGSMDGDGPELTELATVQADAATAATNARTAATDAQVAADAADTARANRATIQTGDLHGGNSGAHAMYAQGHADDADTAATNAETASAAAAEATTVSDATRELVAAETALDDATTAKGKAEGSRDEAVTASGKEVKVVDKTKSVGGTSITIDGSTLDETRNEARKVTGKVGDITTMSDAVAGADDDDATEGVNEQKPGVTAGRTIDVGFSYDSADDDARVTLVISYIGSETVGAYVDGSAQDVMGTKADTVTIEIDGTNTDRPLTSLAGSFYEATGGLDTNGNIQADATEGITVYSYEDADDGTVYVRLDQSTTTNGDTVYTYQDVDIAKGVDLPDPSDYRHLHFGLWASLKDAGDLDNEAPGDLGIGFVTALSSGMGRTPAADMLNHGSATYNGNYVATVQAGDPQGDGPLSWKNGDASMMADFEEGTVAVTLDDLVTLDGGIEGNTFSGTEAAIHDTDAGTDGIQNGSPLNMAGEFTGAFEGGFFGSAANEAGGVFGFTSKDNKDGAFRGSFGGAR